MNILSRSRLIRSFMLCAALMTLGKPLLAGAKKSGPVFENAIYKVTLSKKGVASIFFKGSQKKDIELQFSKKKLSSKRRENPVSVKGKMTSDHSMSIQVEFKKSKPLTLELGHVHK